MMKKLISVLLALMMLCALASCDGGADETVSKIRPFAFQGVTVALDAEASPIIASLGEYVAFAETGSCYGDGKDKVYQYTSFKIQTFSNAGKDYILSVEIFDDADASVTTAEGIGIGARADEVLAKHGTPIQSDDKMILYRDTEQNVKLQFLLRDGIVTNIQYLKIQ